MKLGLLSKLQALRPKERGMVNKFLGNRKLRLKVVKAMQEKGIGVGIDPDDIAAWLELILKYLPQFLAAIAQIIAMF